MTPGPALGPGAGGADRDLRDYFCLADGRTAALVHSSGSCDFWCWPGFDSPLRLAGILDRRRGGWVAVGGAGDQSPATGWVEGSRAMRIRTGEGLDLRCGLVDDGGGRSALAWLVDGPAGAEVRVSVGSPTAGGGGSWSGTGRGSRLPPGGVPDGPGGPLALAASSPLRVAPQGWSAELPAEGLVVCLGAPLADGSLPPTLARVESAPDGAVGLARTALDELVAGDRRWLHRLRRREPLGVLAEQATPAAMAAVERSLLTLLGLQDRESGLLVASPATSLPQWPGSERAWDYRYAWLRDCADAGVALAHAGAAPEAARVGSGLARLLGGDPAAAVPVRRLSGAELPPEHVLTHLRGRTGAPVRIGNGASGQLQLDTLGEVVRLAAELATSSHCPPSLLSLVPAMARRVAGSWRLPDHGIWEVRGDPRNYVHSKVMSWATLRSADRLLGGRGPSEPGRAWREVGEEIAAQVDRRGRGASGALVMSFEEPAPDSSLLAAYLVGYLDPRKPGAAATLDLILDELGRGPLVLRYTLERDEISAPCHPFIFPGFWAAQVESLLDRGEAAAERFAAISALAGPAGQLSEVADPADGSMWGNYPQVQSHAALVDAALAIWSPPALAGS